MYIIAWNYITVQSFMFRSAILLVSYAGWNRRCSGRWINKIDFSEISLSSLQLEITSSNIFIAVVYKHNLTYLHAGECTYCGD